MTEQSQSQQDIAKVYTATRRFPQLIGRTSDGTRIWGGPYTYTQIFGGGGALVVLWKTMPVWSTGGALLDGALVLALTAGVVFGLGKLPLGGRNPLSMLHGLGNAAVTGAPREVGGVAIRPTKPRAVYSPVRILTPLSPVAEVQLEANTTPAEVTKTVEAPKIAAVAAPKEPRQRPSTDPASDRRPDPLGRNQRQGAPPLLVAIDGEGKGNRTAPKRRPVAAQTSVQTLLAMAQQRKEA